MERGLYIAASGMIAELVRQDQLANDLANASTPGYKSDRAAESTFGELLLRNRATGEPLGVARLGDGFLAVQTPAGTRYTRNGQLALEPTGRLVTAQGLPVL